MKKTILAAASVVALSVGGVQPASAQNTNQNTNDKVTICHRTNSVKNPYVRITVDKSAVDGASQGDHYQEHQGPVATSEAVAQGYKDAKTEWGDIIPPVPGAHGGLNWTAQGQAIYNNNCEFAGGGGRVEDKKFTTNQTQVQNQTGAGQNQVPVAGANAGAGGAIGSVLPSLAAIAGSIGTLGYGIMRFRKFNS